MGRMDGAMPVASMVAYNKARSAILFARDTKLLEAGVNGSGGGERHALLSTGEFLESSLARTLRWLMQEFSLCCRRSLHRLQSESCNNPSAAAPTLCSASCEA